MNGTYPMARRRPFDANLSPASQVVAVDSIRRMTDDDRHELLRAFNRYGFAILDCHDRTDSRADLLALKGLLGKAAPHPRADEDGIVAINPKKKVAGFIGSSADEHLVHTDGSFSNTPERIVTLQCVTPARSGGLSLVASAQAAYDHLANHFPERLHQLGRADALTITRTTQSSTQPVFIPRGGDRHALKFRMPDGVAQAAPHPEVRELFAALCRFFSAPENVLSFKLEAGQVLIVDNTALVHGRTPFSPDEPRDMRRLNFDASGPLCQHMVFGFGPGAPRHRRASATASHANPAMGCTP
jgi:alpha-ketoglutarate-dependent taurine dioxygenase